MANVEWKYIEFLKFSLDEARAVPEKMKEMDWEGLFAFAQKQALIGVMFQGLERLPAEIVPKGNRAILSWMAVVGRVQRQNGVVNKRCVELTERLKGDGFRTCILKGQGLALLYPKPELRMSGDIDVWMVPDESLGNEGYPHRKTIVDYVGRFTPGERATFHHVEFPIFEDVMVEAHFTPCYLLSPFANRRLQKWMEGECEGQLSHYVRLGGTEGDVAVPTVDFNLVFALVHVYVHFIRAGVGLRQLVDYYYVLKASGGECEKARKVICELGMEKFARAVMWIMREVMGLSDRYLMFEPDEKEGRFLFDEIVMGGNFGKSDKRYNKRVSKRILKRYVESTKRVMRVFAHYPGDALWEPITRPYLSRWPQFLWQRVKRRFL